MDKLIHNRAAWIPADAVNRQLGLEVLGASLPPYSAMSGSLSDRRTLGTYALACHLDGVSFFESEACRRPEIRSFAVFVLLPGVWHRYGAKGSFSWSECWTVFRGDLADRLVEQGVLSPNRPVLDGLPEAEVVQAFNRLGRCLETHAETGAPQPTAAALFEILSILALHQPPPSEPHSPIEQAVRYLNTREADPISPEQLAERVGLGYVSFRKRFKACTGRSPHQYHLDIKMRRAGQWLAGSSLTVSEIATRLGFDDPYYFSRLFKRKTGHAPLHFRRAATAMSGGRTYD